MFILFMDTIVDELKYNNNNITILKDTDNEVWFNATDICKILDYKKPNDTIQKLVNKNHRKHLSLLAL